MTRKKIAVIIGTRPEAIKMAPVIRALRATGRFDVSLISTGQHGALLRLALATFGLVPDFDLDLMSPGQSLSTLAGRILIALEGPLGEIQPELVLVHGDTTTGFASALACTYRGIPCVHVEAGMRSHNLDSPFPEEFHRRMIARMASHHFAATPQAAENLRREGVAQDRISITGSTAVDAASEVLRQFCKDEAQDEPPDNLVLVTAHRRENHGAGLAGVMRALGTLARHFPDHHFLFPAHPNPAVGQAIADHLPSLSNIEVCEPLPYERFLPLLAKAKLILTDSGGIQEEAAYLGTPVLLLRDTTERPEAVESGTVRIVGCDPVAIVREATAILRADWAEADLQAALGPRPINAFGLAGASRRIAERLAENTFLLQLAS